jgi:hypothetical protein
LGDHVRTTIASPPTPSTWPAWWPWQRSPAPSPYDQAAEILTRTGGTTPDTAQLVDDHRLCYPTLQPGTAL